jgi:hypothetical protein
LCLLTVRHDTEVWIATQKYGVIYCQMFMIHIKPSSQRGETEKSNNSIKG